MKSFEEFADRVDDLLAQVAGPAASVEMLRQAKDEGARKSLRDLAVFDDYRDDESRWTEERARDVAGHIIRETQGDAELVKTALARLAIP